MPWVHPHPLDRLWFDTWNFCGCGNADDALLHIANVLDLHKTVDQITEGDWNTQWDARQKLLDGPNGLLLMYWLDAQGLTEHGGSVYGAWMTDHGKAVLAV